MAYSPTAVYDENNLMIKDGLDTETVKKTLAGLADGSLDIGENGIESVTNINELNTQVSGKKHSLHKFTQDGQRFVNVETDQKLFDGLTTKQQTDLATKILKDRFQGKVIGIDNKAFVNGVTVDEYAHPSKHIDSDLYEAKLRASTELDNLLDAGFNFRNEADGKDGHTHSDVVGGFDYFDVIFKVGSEYYKGIINIKNINRGKLLKDITKIENITKDVTSQYGNKPTYAFLRDASMISIPQNSEKSTESAKKDNRKSLAEDSASGSESTQDVQKGSQSAEKAKVERERTSEAQAAAEAEFEGESVPEMSDREHRRGYSDKEANEARAIIKDFDVMSHEKRLSIVEMMRSAKATGADKSFMKHAAAMIGYWRKGLWIIADDKTSEKGFYQSFEDGSRLIVVNPNAKTDKGKSAINTAFVHELAHDIWDRATVKTRDELYKMATESASAAEVDGIREKYKKGYKERGLKLDADTLREEIFANLIGNTLGNEAFLERFDITPGRMTAFKRSIKAVTRMAKCFFGKDRYLYNKCESMARSLIRVMGEQTALEMVRNSNTRYYLPDGKDNVDPRSVTESDVRILLQRAYEKKYVDGSNIPVRINTPQILLDVAAENGTEISDLPFVMPVRKARQSLSSPLEWAREGNLSTDAHDLSIDEVIDIIIAMNHPKMIVYQSDGRYVEVVEFENRDGERAIAVVQIGENKNAEYMNGYRGGKYQVLVTALQPDDGYIESLTQKEGNKVVYPKKKKGSSQRGSGNSAPSHLNDSPFAISIPQNPKKSTQNAKKSFSLNDNSSAKNDGFDGDEFIRQSMKNGGMIEASAQKAENTAKSQTSDKKSGKTKTKKQIQAELKEAKKKVRSTNKQNKRLAESVVKAQESNRELRAKII